MRHSTKYITVMAFALTLLLVLLFIHPRMNGLYHHHAREEMRRITRALRITDPCLFTEARYIRHLSQADLHSAFQDHPLAIEHFPSGSMVLPPEHLLNLSR